MKFLLWYLNTVHKRLISVQQFMGMDEVPGGIIELKEWLFGVLFHSKDGSLPIFGSANSQTGEFKLSDFGEVQRYLINVSACYSSETT